MPTEIKIYLESNHPDGSSGTTQFNLRLTQEHPLLTLEMIAVMYDEFHELLNYVDKQAWLKQCKEAQELHNKLQLPGTTRWFITADGREIKDLKKKER